MPTTTNFTFLQKNWSTFYNSAVEAEKHVHTAPRTAAFYCRLTLESMVNWMYDNDADFERPYQDNLYALMTTIDFKDNFRPSLYRNMDYVRRLGNQAAHAGSTDPTLEEAMSSLKWLHRVLMWFVKVYDDKTIPFVVFDSELVPNTSQAEISLKKLQKQLAEMEAREKAIRAETAAKLKESEAAKEAMKLQLEAVKNKKEAAKDVPLPPSPVSEAETRKRYIDVYLKEVGWNLSEPKTREFKVTGIPKSISESGFGFADYVLWGDDGKPLAVVEAKKTSVHLDHGRWQAKAYADALEKRFGQRPVIFYTNGYDLKIWDDVFDKMPRSLIGFYSKSDLESLIVRRRIRKPLKGVLVKPQITDRYYQKEAIKRICEALEAKARGGLLVMATGSGKTRTAISLVEVLMRQNWVTRVLFLADRNALVTQAQRSFNSHLPNVPTTDLTRNKEAEKSRIVFSTYPTMMNQIEVGSGTEMAYSVGHFDLIIVDEAHRSVYNKYKAIFDYFDAVKIGLTATPKNDVHSDTYQLFDCSKDNPTYAYELPQAVADQYLVNSKAYKVPTLIHRDGLTYKDLSDKEKEHYEETFRDEATKEIPDKIEGKEFIKRLYNRPTVLQMLEFLVDFGLQIEDETKVGKSIIFARNHAHAVLIEEVFHKHYSEMEKGFIEVIDNYHASAQDAIDRFKNPESHPQIVVSVDMMDTGVDIPEILNLAFFKVVRSNTKYWQMVGRGTRLCPDVFGPEKDKAHFYIFDFCGNIQFFEHNPDGATTSKPVSLTEKLFGNRLQLVLLLQGTEEYDELRHQILDHLHHLVKGLDPKSPRFRKHARQIELYQNRNNWNTLTDAKVKELNKHLAGIVPTEGKDHLARRFDLVTLLTQIAAVSGDKLQVKKMATHIRSMVKGLKRKATITAVKNAMPTIDETQAENFGDKLEVEAIEKIRTDLRGLLQFLKEEKQSQPAIYTNFEDEIDIDKVEEVDLLDTYVTLEDYKMRMERFVRQHKHHITIHKIHTNQAITDFDLQALEQILFDGGERGTKADFVKNYGEQPLGKFIRSIVGLEVNAAKQAFSSFLDKGNLTSDQLQFINTIINHLVQEGFVDKRRLAESPYKEINSGGIMKVFPRKQAIQLVGILDAVNGNVA